MLGTVVISFLKNPFRTALPGFFFLSLLQCVLGGRVFLGEARGLLPVCSALNKGSVVSAATGLILTSNRSGDETG